jgi:hypothetical protein
MPDGRVLIGTGNVLTASPTWTRYDELADCRCAGYTIDTGRQSEFDTTDTGNATVFFADQDGTFNDDGLIGRPIMLQVQDPTTDVWETQFRGVIDDTEHNVNPSAFVSNVQVQCKDIFDYLAQTRFLLGTHGDTVPAGAAGSIYYPEGPVATGTGDPDDGGRIEWILDDGGLDPTRYVVFSGNVDVISTFYDPDDPLLVGLRDACDAEFPGIANCYVDRFGRFVFHGRLARFDPDGVAGAEANWDFMRWEAATRGDVTGDRAQIRAFAWNQPRSRIVNAAIAWPRELEDGRRFPEAFKGAQQFEDVTSVGTYGYRGMRPMGDLIIKEHKTNPSTGQQECQLFAEFYVNNYAVPRKNVQRCTFRSVGLTETYADQTWALMLQADISDIIALTIDEADLADEDFYIEGFSKTVRVMSPEMDYVEVTPNLTPFAYYTDNVFEGT